MEPRGAVGGAMVLTPARWVARPPGYVWRGLSGGSDDGGRTFSGRETESCAQLHAPARQHRDRHALRGTPASVHVKGIDPDRPRSVFVTKVIMLCYQYVIRSLQAE